MNELLKNLLSELKVSSEYHQCFDNSIIEQATLVESKQLFIIELLLETPLAYETYHHLMSQAANHHYDFKIIVKYINSSYAQDLVLSYYKNILNEHFSKESSAFINNIEFSYLDQDLKLVFPSEGIMLLFERYKSKMQSLMEQAGFNLFYQFSIDETHQINDDIEKMITSKDVKIFDYEKSNSDVKKAVKSEVQRDKKVMYRKSLSDLSQYEVYQINDLYDEYKEVCIEGYVFASEIITTRNGKNIQTIKVTDFSDSIILKRFEGRGLTLDDMNLVKKGLWIKAVGDIKYDEYAREHVLFLQALEIIPSKEVKKFDTALEKRVELHLHTNMSSMDGINPIGDYLKQASQFGHTALALTDHNNVQAFPDAQHAGYAQGLKIIYGLESNVIDDSILVVYNPKNINLQDACYVHFDLETTGLSSEKDEIIEIGAVKYQDGMEVDRFQSFVKPVNKVSLFIKQLTGIDDFHLTKQ